MSKKLTDAQWKDILRKHIVDQISARKLSKEYGVPESSIRTRAKAAQSAQVIDVANQLVSVTSQLGELDKYAQSLTLNLAARLCNISSDLAEMAQLGTSTGKTLFAIAAVQKLKIDHNSPMDTAEVLQTIGALTELGNKSATIGREMLINNKALIEKISNPEPEKQKSKTFSEFYAEIN